MVGFVFIANRPTKWPNAIEVYGPQFSIIYKIITFFKDLGTLSLFDLCGGFATNAETLRHESDTHTKTNKI